MGYNVDEDLYHTRYLIQEAEAAGASWAIMTPDGDVYIESYAEGNEDIQDVKCMGPRGGAPAGVNRQRIYRFDDLLDDHEKTEAQQLAVPVLQEHVRPSVHVAPLAPIVDSG